MAEILFITPAELTQQTILSGNIDVDKYLDSILDAQVRIIEPLLGTELYEKIKNDLDNDNLSGLYLELYSDYIKPITKFSAVSTYIDIAGIMVDNGGIFKHAPDNKEIVQRNEVGILMQRYNGRADNFISRFQKWICKHNLSEYKTHQDKVNADKNIKTTFGWKF